MYLDSYDFPQCIFNFETIFFFHISDIFLFFCEKMKNHILYKTQKTKHFRIKFPICTCHFGNIKKTPFITIMENTFFFFELFENVHIEKIRQKSCFISIMEKMITFLHRFREKINKNFQFHTMVTRLNLSTF